MKISDAMFDRYRLKKSSRGYTCDDCGKEIFDYPENRLCERCFSLLKQNDGHTCVKCGRRAATEGVCLDCKISLPAFSKGISAFVYEGETAYLINRLKNGERWLAFFFGEYMAEKWRESALTADFLVSVPMTGAGERLRGYNQSAELAKALSAETGIERKELLKKRRETPPQKQMTKSERIKNVLGAYRVEDRAACKGKKILLVDDIMTTGATGGECARILFSAGAEEVYFLTAASLSERR